MNQITRPISLQPTTLTYPNSEKRKLDALRRLFEYWTAVALEAAHELKKEGEWMVFDGFYPNYLGKRQRALFIGRGAREIEGFNYLDLLHQAYRTTKEIGGGHLKTSQFHRWMLYTAYGLMNGLPEWKDIPDVGEIGDGFATADGVSFAFMNLSKFSNESDHWS